MQVNTSPENTQIKLADSLNLFDPGSLAPGVTVDAVNYRVMAIDAGVKYRGVFAQVEYYNRWLDDFEADGPLPVAAPSRPGVLRAGRVLFRSGRSWSSTA